MNREYALPNDEAENERLGMIATFKGELWMLITQDLQHNLFLLTFDDKLGLLPPNKPDAKVKHVLDVGTGTSI